MKSRSEVVKGLASARLAELDEERAVLMDILQDGVPSKQRRRKRQAVIESVKRTRKQSRKRPAGGNMSREERQAQARAYLSKHPGANISTIAKGLGLVNSQYLRVKVLGPIAKSDAGRWNLKNP